MPAFELLPFVLLDNAIKYAPTNQEIQILFEKLDRKTCVSVKSAGPLLEKDEYKRIFDKHYRGQNSRNLPGEGLGLYLAKQVCDFHNLSIRAESGRALPYNINGIPYGEFKVVIEFNY